jgi:hypothetical protein
MAEISQVWFPEPTETDNTFSRRVEPTADWLKRSTVPRARECRRLLILFRLMFIAYAEDSRHLPLNVNAEYTHYALKTIARRLSNMTRDPDADLGDHGASSTNRNAMS